MGIELPEFQRRFERKTRKQGAGLKALYGRTCEKDGVEADAATGRCRVCRRQVFPVEHDPVPAGVLRPVDPAKAQLQRDFYARLERQRQEREQAETQPKRDVQLLPGESLPGDEEKRDWSKALRALGIVTR